MASTLAMNVNVEFRHFPLLEEGEGGGIIEFWVKSNFSIIENFKFSGGDIELLREGGGLFRPSPEFIIDERS